MAKYKNNSIKLVTNVLKAVADTNRQRIVISLLDKELCVCQIIELLNLAPSTVSKHLYILKQAGLIEANKNGRWVHYKLNPDRNNKAVQKIIRWLKDSLADDSKIKQDKAKLTKILKQDPEQLCLNLKKK